MNTIHMINTPDLPERFNPRRVYFLDGDYLNLIDSARRNHLEHALGAGDSLPAQPRRQIFEVLGILDQVLRMLAQHEIQEIEITPPEET